MNPAQFTPSFSRYPIRFFLHGDLIIIYNSALKQWETISRHSYPEFFHLITSYLWWA